MYINADTIIKAASLLGAIGALVAAIVSVYKVIESNKKQSEFINAIQEEQTLICYGLRGALQGLVEQGCNGPCKDALDKLDKHLNKRAPAHQGGLTWRENERRQRRKAGRSAWEPWTLFC